MDTRTYGITMTPLQPLQKDIYPLSPNAWRWVFPVGRLETSLLLWSASRRCPNTGRNTIYPPIVSPYIYPVNLIFVKHVVPSSFHTSEPSTLNPSTDFIPLAPTFPRWGDQGASKHLGFTASRRLFGS